MILSFKRETPWGEPTDFKLKIQAGIKKHTFRLGDRWKAGNVIDFWEENPRNVTMNPAPFFLKDYNLADQWKTVEKDGETINKPLAFAIERFWMKFEDAPNLEGIKDNFLFQLKIGDLWIDRMEMLNMVAMADGLDTYQNLTGWFNVIRKKRKKQVLTGQVIHWTGASVYDWDTAEVIDGKKLPY